MSCAAPPKSVSQLTRLHPNLSISVALVVATLGLTCSQSDPALAVLEHRQSYSVELKSWVPSDDGVLVEIEVIPSVEPHVDFLTVRAVSFDAQGREVVSVRVPLPVRGMRPGLPNVIRRPIALLLGTGGVGLEIENRPPVEVWAEFPELAQLQPRR